MEIEKIPAEVLSEILCFLQPCDLIQIILVSKKWELSILSRRDRVWKSHFLRDVDVNELDENEKKKIENIEGFFKKYSYFISNLCSFKFSKRFGCYISPRYFHVSKDKKLQNFYLHRRFFGLSMMNVLFVGEPNSGKTSMLIKTLANNANIHENIPTTLDTCTQTIDFNGGYVGMSIWDGEDHENYDFMKCFPNTEVVVLCFAINDPKGLSELKEKHLKGIRKFGRYNSSIVLCGCKTDLRRVSDEFIIPKHKIFRLAKEMKALLYFETSAFELTFLKTDSTDQSIFQSICLAHAIGQSISNPKKNNDSSSNNKCFVM